jgi:HK97 family phage major capsid protein
MAPTPALTQTDRDSILGMFTELKGLYGKHDAAIAAGRPAGEIKAAIDKVTGDIAGMQEKYAALSQRASDLEEKLNEAKKLRLPEPAKSIGERVIEDPGFLAFVKSGSRGSHTVQLTALIWESKDITGLSPLAPSHIGLMAQPAMLPIGVRSLIPQGRTTAGSIQYVEETAFTNNAAPVAEGAAKPKSDKTFVNRTLPVETIAHYFKISRQSYEDLPFVAAQIESNGIYGVKKAEDNQLLNGTGASPQLKGLVPLATAAPAPTGTGANLVDAIGTAVFDLAAKGFIADGVVVNPADWGHVAMIKNAQGNYLYANPLSYANNGSVWGSRIVASTHMAAGTFLVGAFAGHAQILDREDVTVQVATQNEDDFIKNMLTILVEERLALAVYVAAAFEKGVVPAGSLVAASEQERGSKK